MTEARLSADQIHAFVIGMGFGAMFASDDRLRRKLKAAQANALHLEKQVALLHSWAAEEFGDNDVPDEVVELVGKVFQLRQSLE